jgi:hypothetical protein
MAHLAREDQEVQICLLAQEVAATSIHHPTSPVLPSRVAHLQETVLVELRFLSQMQSWSKLDPLDLVEDCTAQSALALVLVTQGRLVQLALVVESNAWAQVALAVERSALAQAALVVESIAQAQTALVVESIAQSLQLVRAMQVPALWAQASQVVVQRP